MIYVRKVFKHRLKESCLQHFKEHSYLPFSNIPMHLQKEFIHDIETKFGIGWLVKQVKKRMTQNCMRFRCNQMKKDKINSSRAKNQ